MKKRMLVHIGASCDCYARARIECEPTAQAIANAIKEIRLELQFQPELDDLSDFRIVAVEDDKKAEMSTLDYQRIEDMAFGG